MVPNTRIVLVLTAIALLATGVEAQDLTWADRSYRSAVARYFELPEEEIAILGHWELPTEEIAVVLFMARRSGISPEALVALRQSGRSLTELAESYRIGGQVLHVPLSDPAAAGSLTHVYERFEEVPVSEWSSIRLTGDDIITLVNVRVLSDSLGLPPDEIMRHTASTDSFVELYRQLLR